MQHSVFKLHLCCSMYQYVIPFHGRIIFHSMDVPNFVHPSINGCLGCFHFLTIMNNVAKDIHIWIFLWMYAFVSHGEISRGEIVG